MATLHGKSGALYLGLTTAVPIAEATRWALTIDGDKVDDSAFGDLWETRLKSPLKWSGSAEGNFDTASSDLFDIAAGTTLCRAYLYPDRADAERYYYGWCWPNLTIDAIRTDAGRVSVEWEGSAPDGAAGGGQLFYPWSSCGFEEEVLADSPTHYWKLDEATPARDAVIADSAGDRDGTALSDGLGSTTGPSPCVTGAIVFNEVLSGAEIALGTSALLGGETTFTLEAWVKPDADGLGELRGILTGAGAGGVGFPWYLVKATTDVLLFGTDAGNDVEIFGATALAADQWYHVAVTHEVGVGAFLYVNGALDGQQTSGVAAIISDANHWHAIGNYYPGGSAYWSGAISRVAIYKGAALTTDRILAHYNAGHG